MLFHNLKLIYRSFRNNRLYSFLNLSGFAIGFAVVLIIALFIYNEINVDHGFKDYTRICRLISTNEDNSFLKYEVAGEMAERFPEVESATPVQLLSGWEFVVGSEGNFATLKDCISTDNSFFRLFSIGLKEGFSDQPFSEKNSAVISEHLASLLFGESSPLGKTIDIGGFIQTRITGVVYSFPSNTSFSSDLFINIDDEKSRIIQAEDNGIMWFPANIYLKLKSSDQVSQLEAKLIRGDNVLNSESGNFRLQELKDIYFEKGIKNDPNHKASTSMIGLFTAIAILILLLSVINHINFSLSLQFSRLHVTGIKKSFGASEKQLGSFHLAENTAGILIAFVIALVIAMEILPLADRIFDRQLNIINLFTLPAGLFIAGVIIAVISLTSIVPIYAIRRFDIRSFISGQVLKPKGTRVNNVLSVFQSTVSIILIAGFITIFKQIDFAKNSDIGFNKVNLLRIKLPGNFEKGELVKKELNRFPFITSSTLSLGVPGMINSRVGSGDDERPFMVDCIEADEDFIRTFGLQLLDGRDFRPGDEEKVCILNKTAIQKYGWEDIENKDFKNYGGLKVIGVVNDFHVASMRNEIEPSALIYKTRLKNSLTLRLAPGNVSQQISQLRTAWKRIMPDNMFDYVFYDEFFNSLYNQEERLGLAVSIFSVLALVITLMGLTGLVFKNCLARTKEIGIRKINGAGIPEIISVLNKNYIMWMSVAILLAIPVSYLAMQIWLQNFVYRTELTWWIFAMAGFGTLLIAVLTVTIQSWHTATRNPAEALRYE